MRKIDTLCAVVALAVSNFGLWTAPVSAAPVPYTWDLSKAVPTLGGGPFTADTILMTTYLYALQPPGGATPESFIFQINGFKSGGLAVSPSGFGTSYGLYLFADATVAPTGRFTRFDIALKADPGNLNGTPSATPADGVGFANTGPTGAADDITLATGSLISASLGIQSNGLFGAHDVQTFLPAAGEQGAFLDPVGNHVQIEEFLFNTATSRSTTTLPDGSILTLVNGGISTADILLPEPASMTLLAAAMIGLVMAKRRRT